MLDAPDPTPEKNGHSTLVAPEDSNGLLGRLSSVGEDLGTSLRRVLDALPGGAQRPNQLAQLLGLNRDISGRVLTATRASDPLTVTHIIPGPEPLRKLLRAAKRKNVSASIIEDAEAAVQQFETLIREQAGDRPALDAIISSLLPDARPKFELAAKQTMFKGSSLLLGSMADMWVHTAIVYPSKNDPDFHDVAHVYGTLGLRRVRPNVNVKFTYRQFGTQEKLCRTISGKPMAECDGTDLDEFCTLPPATLEATATENGTIFALGGNDVGPNSARDKLLAEVRPEAMGRYARAAKRNLKSLFVAPSIPVKQLNFDVLLHDDVYPGSDPSLLLYDTTVDGMASVNDPTRDMDRLNSMESITVLGRGAQALYVSDMPKYRQLIESVCGRLAWNVEQLRGYRCQVQYPMHGCQVCLAFEAPQQSE